MAQFDLQQWTRKAWTLKRGSLFGRLKAVEGIKRVVTWAKKRGFKVDFRPCGGEYGLCFYDNREIIVDPRLSLETQLYVLLHECGHALIDSGQHLRLTWPRGYDAAENGYSDKGYRHMLAIVVEEIEAWNRGKKLASRLKLDLNEKAFELIRDKLLKSHIQSVK